MIQLDRRYAGALLVVLALGGVVLFGNGTPWRGEWNWTIDHVIGGTVLTGPAIACFAAWLAALERQRETLNDSTLRGWQVPFRAAARAAGIGLLGFVVVLGIGLLATASVPHGGPFTWWFLGIVPPLLATYAAVGALVGHLVPQRVVVVLVAPTMFIVGMLADLGVGPNVLRQGPTTGSLAGTDWDPKVVSLQVLVLVGLSLVAVLVPALVLSVAPIRNWSAATVAAVLALAGLVGLGQGGDDNLQYSGELPTACAGANPRVCVAPSHRRSLEPLSRQLNRVGTVLIEAGVRMPATYLEELPRFHGRHNAGIFYLREGDYTLLRAAQDITTPEPCAAWYAETAPPQGAYVARELITTWVMRQLGQDSPAFSVQVDRWVRQASSSAQQKAVVQLFDQLRTCRLAEIRMPWRK